MTEIREIHGLYSSRIGADEYRDRGREVTPISYVPYLSMTRGEMTLQLAAQRNKTLAQFYGSDAPEFKRAYQMLENALKSDVHQGVSFVGAIPDALQNTARLIARAQYETAPASAAFAGRTKLAGIGAIIPADQRLLECVKLAKGNQAKITKCYRAFNIEGIINKYLEPGAHHMLYMNIPQTHAVPTEVSIKRNGHRLGVEGMAAVGEIKDIVLMYQWMENGVLNKNTVAGVGPFGSVKSSFYLSSDPEKYFKEFGISGYHIGNPFAAALVALLNAAIALCAKWLTDLQKVDLKALIEARGFGTKQYSGNEEDWNTPIDNSDNTMLLIALAAGAYLLAQNNK